MHDGDDVDHVIICSIRIDYAGTYAQHMIPRALFLPYSRLNDALYACIRLLAYFHMLRKTCSRAFHSVPCNKQIEFAMFWLPSDVTQTLAYCIHASQDQSHGNDLCKHDCSLLLCKALSIWSDRMDRSKRRRKKRCALFCLCSEVLKINIYTSRMRFACMQEKD